MFGPARSLAPAVQSLIARVRRESDGDLLGRFVRDRDEDAFVELLSRHGPMVLGVGLRVVRDTHAAEDVYQATFLLLARKAATIRRPEGLAAWLHQTAFRLALRSRRRAGGGRPLFGEPQQGAHAPRSPGSALDTLTARELLGAIDDELARLPEEQRQAVVLCGLEGLSLEEAANRLGGTAGSVKGRLERGRARLRRGLEQRGLTLPGAMAALMLGAPPARPLVDSALAGALRGETAASVLALVNGGMSAMSLTKLALGCAAVLLAGLAGLAALHDETPKAKPVAAAGEPLPGGARLRLGALDRRAFNARFAVAADGKTIVLAGRLGKAVTEFDADTGKVRLRRELPSDPRGGVWELAPGGRWLVTRGDGDKPGALTLDVWDVRSLTRVARLPVRDCWVVSSVAFSADGERLAAVALEPKRRRVHVWDWRRGTELLAAKVESQTWPPQVAISPSGRHALLVMDGARCWEVASGKLLWETGATEQLWSVAVTPAGKVISQEFGPKLVERDLVTGEKTATLRLPKITDVPQHTALSADGGRLVVSGPNGGVWDLRSGRRVGKLASLQGPVTLTPDGQSVVGNDGSLQRWDVATGAGRFPDEHALGHTDEVTALAYSADGSRLASSSRDGAVGVWDAVTGKPTHLRRYHAPRGPKPHSHGESSDGIVALDLTPDGRRLAFSDSDCQCWVLDVGRGTVAGPVEPVKGSTTVMPLRLDADGKTLAALAAPAPPMPMATRLVRWDVATCKLTGLHELPDSQQRGGAIDRAGFRATCGGKVYDTRGGRLVADLAGADARVDAALDSGGMLVAGGVGSWGYRPYVGGARVWESLTGKLVTELGWKGLPSNHKVFHPAGRFLAFADLRGIQAWDLRSGKVVKHWPMPAELSVNGGAYRVSCFAFSPDGKTLATGHPDGTILLWDADLPAAKPEPAKPGELDALWRDLGGDDAPKAYQAAWRLAELPREAVPFLRDRVKPVAEADAAMTKALIANLDADTRAARDQAAADLLKLGRKAERAMREALKTSASAEQRRRLGQLLTALDAPGPLTGESLRQVRAAMVLGWIDTPDSTGVLHSLSGGAAEDEVTRQAKAALARRGSK